MDLHELANTGSFGEAAKKLDSEGHFREITGDCSRVYAVSVEYSIGYNDVIEIKADNEEHAKRLACMEVRNSPSLEGRNYIEVYSANIADQ